MGRTLLLLLTLVAILAAGCSRSDSAKDAPGAAPPVPKAETSAGGSAIELTPSPDGFPMGLGASEGFALHLFDTPGSEQGFKKLPPETGSKRHFDEFTIAGQRHLVITEESDPPKFYLDENQNGDLTDDRPAALGEGPGLLPNHYSILIRYPEERVVAPYRLWLFGSNMGGARFYPACHWYGSVTVKGTPYRIVAFDGNSDGDYSNDPVVVDANGNGKAEEGEKLAPGGSITLDGEQVHLISISRSGLTLRLKLPG